MKAKKGWMLMVVPFLLLGIACQKPLAPQYMGIDNLQVNKLTERESIVSGNVKFYNPNHFRLELKRAEVDVFLNDKHADHYLLDSTINIPQTDSFYVPVSLKIDIRNIFSNALQMLISNKLKVSVDGNVKLKRSGIGFSRPFHYETIQKVDSLIKAGINFQ